MQKDIERLIEIFNETGAIQYGNFTFASGKKSNNKIDAEPVLLDEEGAEIVGRLVGGKVLDLEKTNGKQYELAGVYSGGAKVAELAADFLGRDYASLNHKNGEVVGEFCRAEYIICEDVTTKASSIIKCLNEFIYPAKAEVKHAITIVDRQEGAAENLAELGIEHHYFITKEQLGVINS